MFSRREFIEGAFRRTLNDSNEEDFLVGNDDENEVKFHHFGSLEDYGEEPLISDDDLESDDHSGAFAFLSVSGNRERVFVMNSEDASSHADEETLAKIHEMAQEFEKNNLSGPKLVRK